MIRESARHSCRIRKIGKHTQVEQSSYSGLCLCQLSELGLQVCEATLRINRAFPTLKLVLELNRKLCGCDAPSEIEG